MQRLSLIVMLIISGLFSAIYAQTPEKKVTLPTNQETNKIEYVEVVKVEGTPSELYARALTWINTNFKNASEVTKVRDEANGVIEGKHRIRLMNTLEGGVENVFGYVQYEFKLEFKEGRYRYSFYNFIFMDQSKQPIEKWLNPKDPSYTVNTPSHLEQIDKFIKELISSLKKEMKPKVVVKDEW